MADLRVELLTFEGCPHLDQARRDLERVLRESIIETPVQVVYVSSFEDAEFLGFQGSPTIRINGDDVDPQPELPIGVGCRLYSDDEGRPVGSPPVARIRAAVEAHRRGRLREFQRQEAGLVAEYAASAAAAEASVAAAEASAARVEAGGETGEAGGETRHQRIDEGVQPDRHDVDPTTSHTEEPRG